MVQSSTPEKFRHKLMNLERIAGSEISTSGFQNNFNMETPVESMTQEDWAKVLEQFPPLGLDLHKPTRDFIQEKLNKKLRCNLAAEISHSDVKSSLEQDALKASKINTSFLQIGSWQRFSKHEEHLVAKCYFAKRRLVWEILENGLKKKIEIQWEHILSMRVVLEDYQPGILEVELKERPMFFLETEPEPRKHSRWKSIADFTDGQATIFRRHVLKFPPRAFDKHFEKLVRFEPKFLQMCQSSYPYLQNPYFPMDFHMGGNNISFNCNENGLQMIDSLQQPPCAKEFNNMGTTVSFACHGNEPQINFEPEMHSVQQESCSTDPMCLSHLHGDHQENHVDQTICTQPSFPTSVMDLSLTLDELITDSGVEISSSMEVWDEQINNYADMTQGDMMIQGQFSTALPITSQESPIIAYQNNNLQGSYNEQGLHNLQSLMPLYNENQLPNWSNMEDLNAAVLALCSSSNVGYQNSPNENSGGQFHPQPTCWVAPEDSSGLASYSPDQAMECIAGNQNWINPSNCD